MRRRLLLTGGALAWAVGALDARRQALAVPGISVAVATADGIAWGGAGVAHGSTPVQAGTLFQAAST